MFENNDGIGDIPRCSRQARITSREEWSMPAIMASAVLEVSIVQALARSGAGMGETGARSVAGWSGLA